MRELIELNKLSKNILFFDNTHRYYNVETKEFYTSVSKLKSALSQPFNAKYWSTYKALQGSNYIVEWEPEHKQIKVNGEWYDLEACSDFKTTISPDFIANGYIEKASKGRERGSLLHNMYENICNNIILEDYDQTLCKKIKHEYRDRVIVKQEFTVCDHDLKIAGRFDSLNIDLDMNWYLEDLKTDQELKFYNQYQKMKSPLDHLDDCNFNTYSFQLKLYQYLIEKHTSIRFKDIVIKHLTPQFEFNSYSVLNTNIKLNDDIIRRVIDLAKQNQTS